MESKINESKAKEASRVELFSDAVFAIAITLLVLDLVQILHVPSEYGLLQRCLHHWEAFLAFTIGFITILVCWINHHAAFEYITKVDTKFMWINGFLLFVITLTPFPTAVLAEYLETEGRMAVAFFGFNYILISIAADGMCTYAYNNHLIDENHREYYSSYKRIYRYAIFYNLFAFALCFVSIVIPIILYVFLFVVFAAPKEFSSRFYKIRMTKKKRKQITSENVEEEV